MFSNDVSAKFGVSRTKMSYCVRNGIGPALLKDLAEDLNSSVGCYSLMLDETTTAQIKKQCDFLLRFWSEKSDQVDTRYLNSKLFGHTSAEHLKELVIGVLNECNIEMERFAHLSTDGPNITKSLHKLLDGHLKEVQLCKGLLGFNPCNLHKCHNGFHKGIVVYGKEVESLAFELHAWFKLSPCKREDFMEVAAELQDATVFAVFERNEALFYRHVETRWLTLVPALIKIESRWNQTKAYFLEFLPTTKDFANLTNSNKRYHRVKEALLKEKFLKVQLAFVVDVASPFVRFLTLFQSEAPLIHILHDELKLLLSTLMKRFLKREAVDDLSGKQLLSVNVKDTNLQLNEAHMVIGAKTERLLKKLSPFDQKRERDLMNKFFITIISYLQKMFPLGDNVLIAASALNPLKRKSNITSKSIKVLAKAFSHIVSEEEVSVAEDEWK